MRPRPPTEEELVQFRQDMSDLDCSVEELRAADLAFDVAKLKELQARAKKAFRRLALELHPDRTGNDPAKADRFRRLVEVHEFIAGLEMRRPQPQRVVFVSCTFTGGGWGGSGGTSGAW